MFSSTVVMYFVSLCARLMASAMSERQLEVVVAPTDEPGLRELDLPLILR